MTSNQTIDGVPRELVRWMDDFINDGLELSKEEASISAQLRALLDAPAKLDLVECDACPTSGGCVSVCMKAPKPATQPRGVPVTLSPARSERPNSIAKPITRRVCHACAGLHRDVFCPICDDEQPSPVAVELPERRECEHGGMVGKCLWCYERGKVVLPEYRAVSDSSREQAMCANTWNACLDELKRLNTARPANASLPPGAEPCGTHHDNDGLDEMRKPK